MEDPHPPPTTYSPAEPSLQRHHHQTHHYDSSHHRLSPRVDDHEYHPGHSDTTNNTHHQTRLQLAGARGHDSVISHPFSPKGSSPPSPGSSVSSAGRQHHRRGTPEIIQPSSSQSHSQRQGNLSPPAQPPAAHGDPEKTAGSAVGTARSPRSRTTHHSSSNPDVTAIQYETNEYSEKGPDEKAVQLLLFLSGPCAFLSLVITLWTLLSLFVVLILQPLRLFSSKRPELGTHLTSFLAPPLNLQLHLVYSYSSATDYSPPLLLIIHLLSPVVALGVAVASWTAAFFWFFSAILGDPAGQDGHNDGKDSILGVRNWWDRWLSRALR